MTQREVVFPVPPDVARNRLKVGLGTESKVRFDGESLEYEYVLTTNYYGLNHFYYLIAGRLQTSPGGSMLRMKVTQIRRFENKSWATKIVMCVIGCLAIPVGLIVSGDATFAIATWLGVLLMALLGTLIAGGYFCGAWYGREVVANKAARKLREIVANVEKAPE